MKIKTKFKLIDDGIDGVKYISFLWFAWKKDAFAITILGASISFTFCNYK